MKIILDHAEQVATNIHTFWFKPEQPFRYIAGQFIELYLPHDNQDSRGEKRWFTLSSSPSEPLIGITTKRAIAHGSSFKNTLFALKKGSQVTMSEPMGDFVLPKDASIPIIFVAGGIGITPMRSMVKWLIDTNDERDIRLIYATTQLESVAFSELLKSYIKQFEIILSKPTVNWTGLTGHINAGPIFKFLHKDSRQLVYVSGPEPLTEKLEKELLAGGVSADRLVLDFFPNYTII